MGADVTVGQVLSRAQTVLSERGWDSGQAINPDTGCLCLTAAIYEAVMDLTGAPRVDNRRLRQRMADWAEDIRELGYPELSAAATKDQWDLAEGAFELLADQLPYETPSTTAPWELLQHYNDSPDRKLRQINELIERSLA